MTKIKGKLIKHGFDPEKIVIGDDHYQLGALAPIILKPDGDWTDFLPLYEPQAENYETFGCTTFGTLNQLEILQKFLEGKEPNYSERYLYNIVGIEPPGVSPHLVYEAIRKNGVIPQTALPVPSTLEEFKIPRPMLKEFLDIGLKWLQNYEISHEWIISPTHEDIVSTLKFGPIGLSVTAWFEQDGLYVDNGLPNSHWVVCFASTPTPTGNILTVFDSYDHAIKQIHPSHKIQFAKRISLLNKTKVIENINSVKKNWLIDMAERALQFLKDLYKWLFR